MDLIPYNVTLPSQTASILYAPFRDTASDQGWNVTYSGGTKPTRYGPLGVGTGSHRTSMSGASMEFSWVGTALYVYGSATAASYMMSIDGVDVYEAMAATVPLGGLLGSKIDLPYGIHTAKLVMIDGTQVEFEHAVLTVGVAYQRNSSQTHRMVFAITKTDGDERQNDKFFTFSQAPSGKGCIRWTVEGLTGTVYPASGFPKPVPRQMITSCPGSSLKFKVNQTSAFFIYGAVNHDHQWKTVTLRPGLDGELSKTTRYNDFSTILDYRQILHWESGLKFDQEYEVEIVIEGGFGVNHMSFHTLQLIDGGSRSSNSSGTIPDDSPTSDTARSQGLESTGIIGIAIGVFMMFIFVLLAFLWFRRRINTRDFRVTPYTYIATPFQASAVDRSLRNMSSNETRPIPGVLLRESDAGPVSLPPEYDEAWAGGSVALRRR